MITIRGKKHWLWRAIDANGEVLDLLVQTRRNAKAAKRFFQRLVARFGEPRVVITDKLRSYIKPIRTLVRNADHRAHKGLNKPIEVSHRPTRKREKIFGRFKSYRQAQGFLPAHDHPLIAASSNCRAVDQPDFSSSPLSAHRSIPAFYAMIAKRYLHKYGINREDLAQVPMITRDHALLHPNAHMKKPITAEDVLASKPIADPLNMLDCCLISDAGGAMIVTTPERAKDLKGQPIYLHGIGENHTHEHLMCAPSLTEFGAKESSRIAYEMAGLGPDDMDFAELYDCFSIVPVLELEELGLSREGEGLEHWASGAARVGGKLPINTHGGMLSHAHAGAAGGLFGIIEAVRQLRGGLGKRQVEGAEIGIVHNEGGILSSHCTLILGSEQA